MMFEKADLGPLVALGINGAIAYATYRWYKSSCSSAKDAENAPKIIISPELREKLKSTGADYGYVCVEGYVKPTGNVLRSVYDYNKVGVIQTKTLIEHKSKRNNGVWTDVKNIIRDAVDTVAFCLTSKDTEEVVHVSEPTSAKFLMDELSETYDKYEPNSSGALKRGIDRVFGEVTKGMHETEKMLLEGTELLGFGQLVLEGDKIRLRSPKHGRYILTSLSKEEVIKSLESRAFWSKVITIIFLITGSGIITYFTWKILKRWQRRREHDRFLREVQQARAERTNRNETRAQEGENPGDDGSFDPSLCVICLTNPREVVLLNCGHVCLCADCVGELREPKTCPICRQPVARYVQTYTP